MKVSLSILNAPLNDINNYLSKINDLEVVHMDIMDGIFVPNKSFGIDVVKNVKEKFKDKIIDTHLMVQDCFSIYEEYAKYSDYITFHYEIGNVLENIDAIRKCGSKVGISIKPGTNVESIKEYLNLVDLVLVMSVEPGKGGQSFIESSIDKVKYLDEYRKENHLNYLINIDGGINKNTYKLIKNYCDLAVVGSAITKDNEYVKAFNDYNKLFKE